MINLYQEHPHSSHIDGIELPNLGSGLEISQSNECTK